MVQELAKTPDQEVVRIDIVVGAGAGHGLVFRPFPLEEAGLVVHRLGLLAEPLDQLLGVLGVPRI